LVQPAESAAIMVSWAERDRNARNITGQGYGPQADVGGIQGSELGLTAVFGLPKF
jgi:hypothetical protein